MTARYAAVAGAVSILWALSCSHTPETVRTRDDGLLKEYPQLAERSAPSPARESVSKPIAVVDAEPAAPRTIHLIAQPTPDAGPLEPIPSAEEIENSSYDSYSLGMLSVLVRGSNSKRCAINVAGARLGNAPLRSMEVEPGRQKIIVSCGKKKIASKTVDISAGEHETLIFSNADFRHGKARRRN